MLPHMVTGETLLCLKKGVVDQTLHGLNALQVSLVFG